MPYDPSDGTTLTELIRLVRNRLSDFPQRQSTIDTGDGVMLNFRLQGRLYEADSVTATLEGAAETGFTVDYDSGFVTFASAPTGALRFFYSTVMWTDERITEAINSAIDEMFGPFHVAGVNATVASTGAAEILCETSTGDDLSPEDRVTKVEYWADPHWVRVTGWTVENTATQKYIKFGRAPVTGFTIRIHYQVRPGSLDSGSQTLEGTVGLPSRTKEPIVLLACSSLVAERVNARVKDDSAHNTQSENAVKSYEILQDSNFLRSQAETAMRRLKMGPLTARLIP